MNDGPLCNFCINDACLTAAAVATTTATMITGCAVELDEKVQGAAIESGELKSTSNNNHTRFTLGCDFSFSHGDIDKKTRFMCLRCALMKLG